MNKRAYTRGNEPIGRPKRDVFCDEDIHVLKLLAKGMSRSQAAHELGVHDYTVAVWIRAMKRDIGALNDVHLVSIAINLGLLK